MNRLTLASLGSSVPCGIRATCRRRRDRKPRRRPSLHPMGVRGALYLRLWARKREEGRDANRRKRTIPLIFFPQPGEKFAPRRSNATKTSVGPVAVRLEMCITSAIRRSSAKRRWSGCSHSASAATVRFTGSPRRCLCVTRRSSSLNPGLLSFDFQTTRGCRSRPLSGVSARTKARAKARSGRVLLRRGLRRRATSSKRTSAYASSSKPTASVAAAGKG